MYGFSLPGLGFELISNKMSLKRYWAIKRYFHLVNNDETPENTGNCCVKIYSYLDILEKSFAAVATPQSTFPLMG